MDISVKDRQELEKIIKLEKEGRLEFMSFKESKRRSLEFLEKLAENKRKKASGE